MKILDIAIRHFGRFHHTELQFGPHINIIYGKNGSGKSTLHTYIQAMLFGIERGRGRAAHADAYSRYLPWDAAGDYGGALRLEHNGTVCQFTRNFLEDPKDLSVFDETRSRPVTPPQPFAREMLNGLNETTWQNTVSISQLRSETTPAMADELKNYISNLHSAGSGSVDIAAAIASLTIQKKQLAAQLIPVDPQEYEELRRQADALNHQLQEGPREYSSAQMYRQKEQIRQNLEEKKQSWQQLSAHVSQWEEQLQSNGIESTEQIRQTELAMSRAYSAYIRCRGAYRIYRRPLVRRMIQVLAVILFIASLLTLFSITATFQHAPAYVTGLRVLLCVILFAAARILWAINDRGWLWNQAREQLISIFSFWLNTREITPDHYDRLKERLADCTALFKKIDQCKAECSRLSSDIIALQSEENRLLKGLEGQYQADWTSEQNRERLKEIQERLEAADAGRQQNEAVQQEIEAVQLAISTIQSIAENYHVSFVPRLNRECSSILSSLTGGVYTSMSADDNLNIYIQSQGRHLPLYVLSRGTIEQVYLSLRLALVTCFWPDHSVPLLLDDSFALYDDERLEQTLLWLSQHYNGQILLFTCHNREETILRRHKIDHVFINIT